MSTTSSASTSTTAARPAYEIRRQPKRRFPVFRVGFVLLVFAIALLFEPHCFRFAVQWLVRAEAWRCGVSAQMRVVEGSIFEPVRILDSIWIYESENGPVTRVEIAEIEADLSWRALISRGSAPWFQALRFDGLTGKVQLPIDAPARAPGRRFDIPRPRGLWLAGPERIEARNVEFIFESDGDYVRLQNTRFTISELEPGEVLVGQLVIRQPWLRRTFHNVRGTTKLDNARTELAAVTLEPGVAIESLSVELAEIARGRLNLVMQVAAFGGDIRIETQTLPRDRQLAFEATSTFSQIGIGALAAFLGQSDAAGGTIKSGKFTFRGSPQSPAKATASLRLEAMNFQWESRQWDSLVLGASLLDGHVQIPELTLDQGHNFLKLRGEFALPEAKQNWWENEFSFDVNAKIENLTELSALLLPEFKYAAGSGTIDGSVRGDQQKFHGQIIVSGSNITWRNAPIEDLHATLKLNGNELQLTNLAVFNDGDYVRGRGVVNILGDKQYWGELRASIDELGRYSALLQKPIVPEPVAGGGVIDWSGEGSAKGHTGRFLARLHKLRSLGASSALLHPIDADLEGTYQPGAILFSRFGLADDSSSFTANVSVRDKALSAQGIRFARGAEVQLEGDALLPLDVWQAWPNTNFATLLNDATVSKVQLTAKAFDLRAASQLTGWNFPIVGRVSGQLSAEGAVGSLKGSGQLKLEGGVIPLGWSGVLLSDASAEVGVDGSKLMVSKLAGQLPVGDVRISGEVDCADLRKPQFKLALASTRIEWQPFPRLAGVIARAGVALALTLEGPGGAVVVGGEAKPLAIALTPPLELAPALFGAEVAPLPSVLEVPAGPWNAWQMNVACNTAQPLATGAGTLGSDLRITGTVANPVLVGALRATALPATVSGSAALIDEAVIEFRDGQPRNPSIALRASGSVLGERFSAHAVGPLSRLVREIDAPSPISDELLLRQFDPAQSPFQPRISLLAPAAQAAGLEVYPWAVTVAAAETAATPQ